jgi:hypothetical protein
MNMREIDKVEIFGNLPTDNPLQLAAMCMQETTRLGKGFVAWLDGIPRGVIGVFQNWPGNWQMWSFGHDDYRRCAIAFYTRIDALKAFVVDNGGHRLECRSHVSHVEAQRFLEILGAEQEARLKAFGKDGADYFVYSWTGERLSNVHGLVTGSNAGASSSGTAAA